MNTLPTNHLGRKVSRVRELMGMKQEALAVAMGVSQQAVSKLEQCEWIDPPRLRRVADALGVTPDAIVHFSDKILTDTLKNGSHEPVTSLAKLISVYERLLQCEREKVALLEERFNAVKRKAKN